MDRPSFPADRPDKPAKTEQPVKAAVDLPAVDLPVETRTRGEVYADTRQYVESRWDRHLKFDAPRDELARFNPERARLPAVQPEAAASYLDSSTGRRPWLKACQDVAPESRRIFAAADQGDGHGHIRHEGWVTEERVMRRVAYLEDPAQLDPAKRLRGIDGLKPGDKRHFCADIATRITDPDAFATAFAKGVEHPEVQAALKRRYDPDRRPVAVELPISYLLGNGGHKHCTGWQLEPVNGSMDTAIDNRKAWRAARIDGREPIVPEPQARAVPTFEGGNIVFAFGHNKARDGYEIVTMYAEPPGRP